MDSGQHDPIDDRLDRATNALRDMQVPAGPSPELVAKTLAAARRGPARHTITASLFRLAAALAMVASVAWLLIQGAGTHSVAFGDVLEAVRNTRSVRFEMTSTTDLPGQQPIVLKATVIAHDGRMRSETPQGVSITDFRQQKLLTLLPQFKRASLLELANMAEATRLLDPVAQLRNMHLDAAKDSRSLGHKEIGGCQSEGFEITQGGVRTTVWVDIQTHLPVEGEVSFTGTGLVVVSRDFTWDLPVDESLFSLTPPADYEVSISTLDASKSSEPDLIMSLSLLAQMNEGEFPEIYGMAGMPPFSRHRASADERTQKLLTVNRGFIYVKTPGNGSDWHYAGKGVALDTPNRPILWYKPEGSAAYRVISADLSVREVAADKLPTHPSVLVDPARILSVPTPRAASTTAPSTRQANTRPALPAGLPQEQDLVTSLSLLAEMNDDRFTDGYGMTNLMGLLRHRGAGDDTQTIRDIVNGFTFVMIHGNGSDWHYAGKGVAANTPDRPIFWYKPMGSANYRVINADLSVHAVAADQLPKIPSVVIDPGLILSLTTDGPERETK